MLKLGVGFGSAFAFDVYTSGGSWTDALIDALSSNNPSTVAGNWGTPYVSTEATCVDTPWMRFRPRAQWRSSAWLDSSARVVAAELHLVHSRRPRPAARLLAVPPSGDTASFSLGPEPGIDPQ